MAVLDVQNLTLSFGENTLFDGVSFDIKEKEKVTFYINFYSTVLFQSYIFIVHYLN